MENLSDGCSWWGDDCKETWYFLIVTVTVMKIFSFLTGVVSQECTLVKLLGLYT